jgi:hypothetical protein
VCWDSFVKRESQHFSVEVTRTQRKMGDTVLSEGLEIWRTDHVQYTSPKNPIKTQNLHQ